ncbi:TetR/AcrR family transcriptional regulator [Actinoallomurus sp. CA-142502]|uniref:TetR/AcrR family transcriptional regulator n=1 Tax=Actinoallomurus sp. CA-142502 TaxID=3239885 RepID=UPI003D929B55
MTEKAPGSTRRRGADLERAIYAATLNELAEAGYADLALDRIAQRAKIGRSSLYRRWSSKQDLVAEAVTHALPPMEETPDTGSVREDLLICFERMHRLLDGLGRLALQAVAAELHDSSDNALVTVIRDRVLEPRLQLVLDVLLRGVGRGEIRAEAAVPLLARAGPALLFQHLLMYGTVPPRSHLEDIVDRVILPAARP